ncbi:hypothetical protein [Arthrobacter sp. AFG20]|uniref:hypothetical protein n=1 Tax=Arthrobacter sp. AFG20 TaxID=1688671 RepID=UPI002155A14C|nr:hypothetical protein [Arthrobacter sp. AFG20]
MGIGDSIGKAAENAMEDLGQTSDPTDDAHAPEPGASDEDIQVHSSISEGSNARDGDDGPRSGVHTTYTPQGPGTEASGGQGTAGATGASGTDESADESAGTATSGGIGAAGATDAPEAARGVPGPAGLPDPDPEELRADPSEGDQDPGTGLGRG